jgi:3-oxoacyl-[acyl-carrier protein] reductase
MNIKLQNRIALITGASRGIGKAIAKSLGQSGAYVIGTATSDSGVKKIEEEFKNNSIQGLGYWMLVSLTLLTRYLLFYLLKG